MKVDESKPTTAVVDASFIAAQLFPDENAPDLPIHITQFLAPELLKFEVANAFKTNIARKRVPLESALILLQQFLNLPITYHPTDFKTALQLAIKHNLSAYDASYLELSISHHVPLLSLDKTLSTLAR